PVGRGRAGTNINIRIVTAKPFSSNRSLSAPSVLASSPRSQRSSWSLKGSSVSVAADNNQESDAHRTALSLSVSPLRQRRGVDGARRSTEGGLPLDRSRGNSAASQGRTAQSFRVRVLSWAVRAGTE